MALARQRVEAHGDEVDVSRRNGPRARAVTREDGIEVRFAARDGRRTPRLFDLRLLNADAAP